MGKKNKRNDDIEEESYIDIGSIEDDELESYDDNTNDEVKVSGEEEIIQYLERKLIKPTSVSLLCAALDISEYALFGYIKKMKDKAINVSFLDKGEDKIVVINNHPDLTKENTYRIEEDLDSTTKIGVISDLRFGSKNEQIAMLNDMYRKFAEDGVKYVIITGNLLEGEYKGNDEYEFGSSLISNSGYGQANHLIEYFPKVEGIQTLFITGNTDHKWSKVLNVGEYISGRRSDMTYLGPKGCTVFFNNVSIRLDNLKKQGEAYTIAYPPQKYSRSMASYEDYDAIFLGGTLTAQDFPQIRDTRIFTIPSVVSRTPKMKSSYQQNTMGSYEFEISYKKTGKLNRMVSVLSPYYVPSKDNYLTVKPLNIKKNEDDSFSNVKEKTLKDESALFERLDKLYRLIKKEESFNSLKNRLGMSDYELYGIIDLLQQYGREIEVVDVNNELVVRKYFQKRRHYEVKPPKEELTKKTFGVVSDTHYGSIWCQPSMVNTFAYEAYNRGINLMLHIGDISDGDYSRIRPNHVNEVFVWGATGQVDYVAKTLPKYPGMEWKGICGSHDQSHSFNYGPFVFGEELAKRRKDFEYLGQDRAYYYFDKCKVELFHPGGGTSRILSTKPQNGIDQIQSGTKSNLSFRGHYHKVYYALYRNMHMHLCPCNVDQSSFMMKNEIPNLMGDYFITIWYDDNGDIQYIESEPMIFKQEDVRERDYENPTKYMKNKILTLK